MNKYGCQHLRALMVAVVTTMATALPAQVEVEYFVDSDPGLGKATQVSTPVDADGNITFQPPTSGLTSGNHLLGVRAYSVVAGTTHYAPTLIRQFFVPSQEAAPQIRGAEYFWDADPGFGHGTAITFMAGSEINLNDIEFSTTNLTPGNHTLSIRAYGDGGWGPTLQQTVYVPYSAASVHVTYLEYYWDTDPGLRAATPIVITAAKDVSVEDLEISTANLTPGSHKLGIRAYGVGGWGPTLERDVFVPRHEEEYSIIKAEYFFDTDPGFGLGTPIAITPGHEVTVDGLGLAINSLSSGSHLLGVRYRGTNGWSATYTTNFAVPMGGSDAISSAEYFFDTDPGFGFATPISVTAGQEVSVDGLGLALNDLPPGSHLLGIRYRGTNGWSATYTTNFAVTVGDGTSIATAEYFWNEDPGFGRGTPIVITPGEEVTLEDVGIPTYDVQGDAVLYIRYRGPQGWSSTVSYLIMVDAEGNYTLNVNAATDISTRNYQTLGDAVSDFADRGIGDDITMTIPTTSINYPLDATGEEVLAQFAAMAESLDNVTTPQTEKTIDFTAANGSGNTLSITTTAEGLPTIVRAMAHTTTENVALTINGIAYDFTAASLRHETLCSGSTTTAINLSGISTAIAASWKALPHTGTKLSGFSSEGEGDLPTMTLTNSGTQLDSLAYVVTLSDTEGQTLCTYTYYIYVHPNVSEQTFSGMSPAEGSSLDPGQVTLKWNAIGGAVGGYRVEINARPSNDMEAEPVTEIIDTDNTSCNITIATGWTYTWTVTAFGFCNELTSPSMTLEGRLLPDLVVTSVALPEVAEAGNQLTVTATITNQGEGATTERQWTDRLYYVIDSDDFQQAVLAAEVKHTGNLPIDESYNVTFTMKVPYMDAGTLRVFVETDITAKVMETDDDNNRTLSTSSAMLQPFYINTTDLAALRKLYNDLGGNQWTGTKWNVNSELISENNWNGVTFDTEGRVTAINLQGRGLTGTLSEATALSLPALTTLNLSHNELTGDVSPFVASLELTSLNLSHNRISSISSALPPSISTLNVSNQTLSDVVVFDLATMNDNGFLNQLPLVVRYNHQSQNYNSEAKLKCVSGNGDFVLTCSGGTTSISSSSALVYKRDSGDTLAVSSLTGLGTGTTFRMKFSFPQGDATFNVITDILDLQSTINYMFNKWNGQLFNYAAVNLFPDAIINIQDAIRLVDVLINEPWYDKPEIVWAAPRKSPHTNVPARLIVDGNLLKLSTTIPVTALDIVLSGCDGISDVEGLAAAGLSYNSRQADSSLRLIAYSFNDSALPVGEITLCQLEGDAPHIQCAKLSDAEANKIYVETTGCTTGIYENASPVTFKLYSTAGILVAAGNTADLESTTNFLPSGVYVLKLTYSNGREIQSKLRIESR